MHLNLALAGKSKSIHFAVPNCLSPCSTMFCQSLPSASGNFYYEITVNKMIHNLLIDTVNNGNNLIG